MPIAEGSLAKVRITGLDKELKRTKLRIGNALARAKFNETIQKETIQEARKGGLKPKLMRSTVQARKRLQKYNSTHPDYSAGRSNLTFSGELLDAIRVKFITSKLTFVYDALKTKHKKYKGKKGRSKASGSISNRDLLEIQNEVRPILQVFDREYFIRSIENKLKDAIKRFFK
jgi:hypothetical protein